MGAFTAHVVDNEQYGHEINQRLSYMNGRGINSFGYAMFDRFFDDPNTPVRFDSTDIQVMLDDLGPTRYREVLEFLGEFLARPRET